jgi:hypothetical protein
MDVRMDGQRQEHDEDDPLAFFVGVKNAVIIMGVVYFLFWVGCGYFKHGA